MSFRRPFTFSSNSNSPQPQRSPYGTDEDYVDSSLTSTTPSRTMLHALADDTIHSTRHVPSGYNTGIDESSRFEEIPGSWNVKLEESNEMSRDDRDDTPLRVYTEVDDDERLGREDTPLRTYTEVEEEESRNSEGRSGERSGSRRRMEGRTEETHSDYEGRREGRNEDEEEEDDRQCRICLAGVEEEETMGRLISPCLCSGSMRYVHVNCINAWRGTGTNAKAFLECPQCHHQYRLRRTLVSGLATSRPILLFLSIFLFFLLSLLIGQFVLFLTASPLRNILSSRSPFRTFNDYMWSDDLDDSPVVVVSGGGALVYDIFTGAISTFSSVANSIAKSHTSIPTPLASFGFALIARFLLGLAVLGSISFLSLMLSLSLFGPMQLANGVRGTGLFGSLRRRGNRGGRDLGEITIVFFVLIGAINTLRQTYGVVQRLTRVLLRYVETQILEVNSGDVRRARERQRGEEWWKVWWREKRWMSFRGWGEVGLRARVEMQERARELMRGRQEDHEE
ncbi:hypothetical protein TREMEDRAFT_64980 [Tremella mesenterica DSM 1558]|uniref:uncharacterized protein n=1 Tax=Tremella mesenterica (strain ATCC 24925 / CBS 8224 / DSM 1558 / NBRC 9311 / NRRL Y-6157 / RJB 2259-6 / UBC 559-6) TaxID=578456 RepID=UPI0003F495D6|nr:uncharacterized protein TREMEDRAFT_64980 [Tremella mesenterica DSM 1558]EIW67111.1 hypothetical protein TREMEDRAFT_64980 [Tremella mesenterica DSM 1558]